MPLVRLLLSLALISIGVSLLLYFIKKDRRYLRFILQVLKFTLLVLVVVFLIFAGQRLLMPGATPLV